MLTFNTAHCTFIRLCKLAGTSIVKRLDGSLSAFPEGTLGELALLGPGARDGAFFFVIALCPRLHFYWDRDYHICLLTRSWFPVKAYHRRPMYTA